MVYRRMKGRGGLFPAKRFINRAFQNEGEGGVRPSPSRRVMRKRSGRSNASAAKTVARSENCRARAFRSLLLGMLFRRLCGCDRSSCGWQSAGVLPLSACQRYDSFISTGTFVHTANGRARAFRSLLLGMLFRRLRGRDRSFCEWQSAGVLRLLYDRGTIPSSAPARLYIRRMAE